MINQTLMKRMRFFLMITAFLLAGVGVIAKQPRAVKYYHGDEPYVPTPDCYMQISMPYTIVCADGNWGAFCYFNDTVIIGGETVSGDFYISKRVDDGPCSYVFKEWH